MSVEVYKEVRRARGTAALVRHEGTGRVTAFLANLPGGPIVTGETEEEALEKFDLGMVVLRVFRDAETYASGGFN